jgi:DNA-binding MarR family transcriptional regulator
MTRPAVQRFLAALERQGMIRRESGRFGTRITLVGYDEDQPAAGDEADQ